MDLHLQGLHQNIRGFLVLVGLQDFRLPQGIASRFDSVVCEIADALFEGWKHRADHRFFAMLLKATSYIPLLKYSTSVGLLT